MYLTPISLEKSTSFQGVRASDVSSVVPLSSVDQFVRFGASKDIFEKRIFGRSVLNRPMEMFVHVPEHLKGNDKIQLDTLLVAMVHGNEPVGREMLLRFMDLLRNDEEAFQHIKNKAVGIIPVLNPDGAAKLSGELQNETLEKGERQNHNQVDLNRNFRTRNWNHNIRSRQGGEYFANEGEKHFSGHKPHSEPETRSIVKMLKQYQPKKVITLHAPQGRIRYLGPGKNDGMVEAMQKFFPYNRTMSAEVEYPFPGSLENYIGVDGQVPTVAVELFGNEPLETVWDYTRKGLMAGIDFEPEEITLKERVRVFWNRLISYMNLVFRFFN